MQLAVCTARRLGLVGFHCLQNQWNLLSRSTEWEANRVCSNEGVGVIPFSPLKGKESQVDIKIESE